MLREEPSNMLRHTRMAGELTSAIHYYKFKAEVEGTETMLINFSVSGSKNFVCLYGTRKLYGNYCA